MIDTLAVPAARVRPLRAELLRPGQDPERLVYPGDDSSDTLHVIAVVAQRERPGEEAVSTVGVASVMADPHPRTPAPGDWRVRGMATLPGFRGRGLGAVLLAHCEVHARTHGGRRIWCNARLPAQGFYARAGWSVESDVFDVEDIGPHVIMAKPIA